MFVFMTTGAFGGQSQVGAGKILREYPFGIGSGKVSRLMTGPAGERRVLPLQDIACPTVVEPFEGNIPVNEGKVPPVVLRVARNTGSSTPVGAHKRRMQAAGSIQSGADFLVTVEAFVFRRPLGQIVAGGTVSRAVQRAVSLRQYPW
jgi:hypothetical protein